MRRITWIFAIVICLSVMIAGCGKKDAGSVVKDLDHVINKMEGYKTTGKMVLLTGQEPLEYQVEVWHQKPHYYRIALTNNSNDITQIVLRNDDGVFVLTPHLNKSFRFKSDWPDNQGQVYLYQSLAKSILDDKNRQFAEENGAYIFDVTANYQNASLARQKIWLDANNFAPKRAEVSDANGKVLVMVEFNQFEFGTKFEKDSFDMQRNMTSWNIQSLPTIMPEDDQTAKDHDQTAVKEGETSASENENRQKQMSFGVVEPGYTPSGVTLQDVKDIRLGEEPAVMLRYTGAYNYTLVELQPTEQTVSVLPAEIVDLGFTLGVMTGEGDYRTLSWTNDGIEFRLSTGDLPLDEMINIAASVQGQLGK